MSTAQFIRLPWPPLPPPLPHLESGDVREVALREAVLLHDGVELVRHARDELLLLALLAEHGHLGAEVPDDERVHLGHCGGGRGSWYAW